MRLLEGYVCVRGEASEATTRGAHFVNPAKSLGNQNVQINEI